MPYVKVRVNTELMMSSHQCTQIAFCGWGSYSKCYLHLAKHYRLMLKNFMFNLVGTGCLVADAHRPSYFTYALAHTKVILVALLLKDICSQSLTSLLEKLRTEYVLCFARSRFPLLKLADLFSGYKLASE